MNHALRVMKYVETILTGIGSNQHEIEMGKIAAYLHDVGAIEGKDEHASRSAKFAENYLKSIFINDDDLSNIVHAIADHSKGESLNSNIGAALTLSDKIDMFEDRMLRFKENYYFHDNIKHVKNIEINVDELNIYIY